MGNPFDSGPHDHVPAGAGELAHWRFGHGPPVVFVHGWPLHAATFRRLVPLLADDFTLHVFDLPRVGQTRWPAEAPHGLAPHAATLRRAIDALGLEAYALLAHDSGAAMARIVAADDRRVRGLVMGNTEIPGHRGWQIRVYVALAQLGLGRRLFRRALALGPVRRGPLGFGGCFRDAAFVDGDFGELFVRPMLRSDAIFEGQMALAESFDFELVDGLVDVHARIEAPTLLVWGTDDPFFPLDKARAMLPQLRGGARLVEIPGAKLFAHEDHPEAFAAHARPFLREAFAQ